MRWRQQKVVFIMYTMCSMCSLEHVQQNVGNILVTVCSLHRILLVYLHIVGRPFSGAGPLTRVPTRLATGHTFDHSRLKNTASEKEGKNIRWIMSEEDNLEMFGLFCVPPILMAPPPYPLHPDVSQPGSFCLRAVSQQNICKSMCGNWKSPVYNSWSPFSFLTNVITRCRKYFEKDEPIGIQARKSKKIHSDTILEIPLFSHRCHHNGHRITYCCQNESTENH